MPSKCTQYFFTALCLVFFFKSNSASAGIMVEPYIGYSSGAMNLTNTSAVESKIDFSGPEVGMRLGYKFVMPWIALDYSSSVGAKGKMEATQYETTKNQVGAVLGVDVPFGIRLYAGYSFQNNINFNDGATELKFLKGNATRVGIGLGMIPLVSLNFEYAVNKFDQFANESSEASALSGTYTKQNFNTAVISISAPFDL